MKIIIRQEKIPINFTVTYIAKATEMQKVFCKYEGRKEKQPSMEMVIDVLKNQFIKMIKEAEIEFDEEPYERFWHIPGF